MNVSFCQTSTLINPIYRELQNMEKQFYELIQIALMGYSPELAKYSERTDVANVYHYGCDMS